jgi:hypothetical protein
MNSDGVIEDVFQFMDEAFGERSEVERLAVEEGRWV